jgi:hypothetical protein
MSLDLFPPFDSLSIVSIGGGFMEVPLKCSCGKIGGVAEIDPKTSNRASCLCDDCQAFAHFLGRASEILDKNGGTDIVPVVPRNFRITQGHEHLACVRLSPKGMYRWYAGCCKTPIANSPSAGLPFLGTVHLFYDLPQDPRARDQALGPIRAKFYGKFGYGEMGPDISPGIPPLGFVLKTVKFMLLAKVRGMHKPSPFYGADGAPVVEPRVLTKAERDGLGKTQ